jgi:hypothetical protein
MSGPIVHSSDQGLEGKGRRTRAPTRASWAAAVILGVAVSVLVLVSNVIRDGRAATIAGLALGILVAGMIVRARDWREWLAVGMRVVAAQLLLGVVLFVLWAAAPRGV